jgi:hypothetical protein
MRILPGRHLVSFSLKQAVAGVFKLSIEPVVIVGRRALVGASHRSSLRL